MSAQDATTVSVMDATAAPVNQQHETNRDDDAAATNSAKAVSPPSGSQELTSPASPSWAWETPKETLSSSQRCLRSVRYHACSLQFLLPLMVAISLTLVSILSWEVSSHCGKTKTAEKQRNADNRSGKDGKRVHARQTERDGDSIFLSSHSSVFLFCSMSFAASSP
jgi:hypothetical protein